MLRITRLAVLTALVACSSSSGPDDDDNNNNNGTFNNQASATINSTPWTSVTVLATRTAVQGIVAVTFVAHGASDTHVSFGIANASGGTYNLVDGGANQASFKFGGKSYGQGENGTIRIDQISATGMKGSFTINARTSAGESGSASGTFEARF
jgi:hypothetical protein